MAEPTQDEQFEKAESLYLAYRETTNGLLAVIHDGPWEVATYGITPTQGSCDDGWQFDFARTTTIDPESITAIRDAAAEHLENEGFDVEDMDLGNDSISSRDLIVREQGVYSLLTVTFVDNGNVAVAATTACNAGDPDAIAERVFGGNPLDAGPLPKQESPSDPVQFRVEPAEPSPTPSG